MCEYSTYVTLILVSEIQRQIKIKTGAKMPMGGDLRPRLGEDLVTVRHYNRRIDMFSFSFETM